MRIAVVEDERTDRDWLLECLKKYEQSHDLKFDIRVFEDGEGITADYRADYDLILMDIEMRFVDGMTAAREIRRVDEEVSILFITNAGQYVMNGYEVDALDYLLKPVSYFALEKRLDRAVSRQKQKRKHFVRLRVRGGFQNVDSDRIRYVETDGQGVLYHTLDGDYRTWGSLQDVERILDNRLFFRCNKCYLVNLNFIDGFIGNDVTVGRDVLQVSRSRKKPLLDAMNLFISETML